MDRTMTFIASPMKRRNYLVILFFPVSPRMIHLLYMPAL